MGGEGTISAMISSLKYNDRRKKREHFEQQDSLTAVKTEYDFPEVSVNERRRVVREILQKRKKIRSLKFWEILVVAFLLGVTILGAYVIVSIT